MGPVDWSAKSEVDHGAESLFQDKEFLLIAKLVPIVPSRRSLCLPKTNRERNELLLCR